MFKDFLRNIVKHSPVTDRAGGNAVTLSDEIATFLPVLDELYEQQAITSIFEVSDAVWSGTKKILIPTISVDGNADYSRSEGYVDGGIAVDYVEKTLTHDRGRRFNVDAVTLDEVNFDLIAAGMSKFERTQNVKEVDAIRFAALSQLAGTTKSEDITTSEAAIAAYDAAELKALELGLDLSNSIMYISAGFYTLIKNHVTPSINANTNNGVLDRTVKYLDNGLELKIVPNDRFYSEIKLLTGGDDEEAGGYTTTENSRLINFLLVDKDVPQAVTKRRVTKIIPPEQNQKYDGVSVYYRNFHDIYIEDEQAPHIYASVKQTA